MGLKLKLFYHTQNDYSNSNNTGYSNNEMVKIDWEHPDVDKNIGKGKN